MFIEISKAKEFSSKFISTISKVADVAALRVESGKISCIVEGGNRLVFLGLYEDESINVESPIRLNIGGFKNFSKLIDFVSKESETLRFKLTKNCIEYKDKDANFKYHLLDDSIMNRNSVKYEKIVELKGDFACNLSLSKIRDLLKASSTIPDTEKCYFFYNNGKLFCEMTDRTVSSANSLSFDVASDIDGETSESFPISLEIIRTLASSSSKEGIDMSIHTSNKCFIFEVVGGENTFFKYITSALLN